MEQYNIEYLSLKRVNEPHLAEMKEAVNAVIESGWYLQGKAVQAFEDAYAAYIGTRFCVSCANGLDALKLILRAYIEMGWRRNNRTGQYLYRFHSRHFRVSTRTYISGTMSRYVQYRRVYHRKTYHPTHQGHHDCALVRALCLYCTYRRVMPEVRSAADRRQCAGAWLYIYRRPAYRFARTFSGSQLLPW